jgi:phosphoribosylformylglycinamidine synthase
LTQGLSGGRVPKVDPALGRALFRAVHAAISRGLIRSCHDLSEGGLAAALAEMALAGGLGARVSLGEVPSDEGGIGDASLLFSESPSRFLLEVRPADVAALNDLFRDLPLGRLGEVTGPADGSDSPRLTVTGRSGRPVIDAPVSDLKSAWQRPLRW